jgi:ElaA protein
MDSSATGTPIRSKRFDDLSARELHAILRLRGDVFVVEQDCAYADVDGRDDEPGTVHHWIEREGHVAAYARALADPDGSIRIGRVVTAPSDRGSGLAAVIVRHITASTPGHLVLDAQTHLVGWYERLGYEPCGAEYVEDGIPHVPMQYTGLGAVSGE